MNDLPGTASKAAQLGDKQHITRDQALQQLINAALLWGSARGHRNSAEVSNLQALLTGLLQQLKLLTHQILFVGGGAEIRQNLAHLIDDLL